MRALFLLAAPRNQILRGTSLALWEHEYQQNGGKAEKLEDYSKSLPNDVEEGEVKRSVAFLTAWLKWRMPQFPNKQAGGQEHAATTWTVLPSGAIVRDTPREDAHLPNIVWNENSPSSKNLLPRKKTKSMPNVANLGVGDTRPATEVVSSVTTPKAGSDAREKKRSSNHIQGSISFYTKNETGRKEIPKETHGDQRKKSPHWSAPM